MILLLLSCADPIYCIDGSILGPGGCPEVDTEEATAAPPVTALAAPRLLRRMSLDLRGVLPAAADLDAVEADPTLLATYRDAWLDDPRLSEAVVDMLGQQWHTRVDVFNLDTIDYDLDITQEYALERAVGEEPLRLAAHIITTDAPWSELVTANYTVVDDLLLDIWPLTPTDPTATGWQTATYTDGRPPAGVLATNGLWWRYWTTNFNYNRSRAAAMMRILVCEDLLQREVSFSDVPALVDEEGTETAIREAPACVNCHSIIDPIAATLFGFWWYDLYDTAEMTRYHPERELLYETYLDLTPAWAGTPVSGLTELGQAIADDPRFTRCAVETFAQGLWRREVTLSDFAALDALRDEFITADQRVQPLLAAILDTPTYQAGGLTADATDEDTDREVLLRPLSPLQLSSAVADLTGYTWTWEGDLRLDEDTRGFRIMTGGVDGLQVTAPQRDPGLTSVLVTRRLAEAAAQHGLHNLLDPTLTPTDPGFTDQLDALHWRLYAMRAEADWQAEITELWEAFSAEGDEAAWVGVLSVMLQDPLFVTR
ncbi:MAG: hypothetical protein ACI8RZ_006547 [Myxococcota bacterium]|jgi:hypothetical protein